MERIGRKSKCGVDGAALAHVLRLAMAIAALCWPVVPAHSDTFPDQDLAWVGWPNTVPGESPFSQKGRGNNWDQQFPASGPLSRQAADRAGQNFDTIGGLGSTGEQQVLLTPTNSPCSTGKCTAAQRAAEVARVTSQAISSTASSRMNQELQARKEIQQAVERGVGTQYSQEDVGRFNRAFQERKYPTDQQIQNLHPNLRDAATALRTSRAIENYLGDTIQKHSEAARKTDAMAKKLDENHRNFASLDPHAGGSSSTRGEGASSLSSGDGDSAAAKEAARTKTKEDLLAVFSADKKTVEMTKNLDDHDNSPLAKMLRGLQDKVLPEQGGPLTPEQRQQREDEHELSTLSSIMGSFRKGLSGFDIVDRGPASGMPEGDAGKITGGRPATGSAAELEKLGSSQLSDKETTLFARVHSAHERHAPRLQ